MIQAKSSLALALTFFSVTAFSCGNGTPKKLGAGGVRKTPPQRSEDGNCPARPPSNYHEVTIRNSGPLPKKVAVILENARRVDECKPPLTFTLPPITSVTRTSQFNAMIVRVQHDDYYRTLPTDTTIDVIDLGDCDGSETPFMTISTTLEFKTEFPKENCPGIQVAHKIISH